MRRPEGTDRSEVEVVCPLGDRREASRGIRDKIPERLREKSLRSRRFEAEAEGFEPPEPFSSTVFKTAAIDHSATPPKADAKVTNFYSFAKNFQWKSIR